MLPLQCTIMKWKKVARKLQSVGEAGYAFSPLAVGCSQTVVVPRQPELKKAARPLGKRQRHSPSLSLSVYLSLSDFRQCTTVRPTDMSSKALNFLPSILLFLLPGFFAAHECLEILSLIFETSERFSEYGCTVQSCNKISVIRSL